MAHNTCVKLISWLKSQAKTLDHYHGELGGCTRCEIENVIEEAEENE